MDKWDQRLWVLNKELSLLIDESVRKPLGQEKIWIMIDEAQKCPQLFDQIKIIYDIYKGKDKVKFILTGSAHLGLHPLSTKA